MKMVPRITCLLILGLVSDRCCAAFTVSHRFLSKSLGLNAVDRETPTSTIAIRVATSSSSSPEEAGEPLDPSALSLPPGRSTKKFARFLSDDTLRLLNPKSMARYQLTRKKEFGPIFKTNVFFTPTVFVADDDTIQKLGVQESVHRGKFRAFFPPHHQKLFGPSSLLVTSGLQHDRVRQLVAASLSPTVVANSYQTVVQEGVRDFFHRLASEEDAETFRPMVPRVRAFFVELMLQVVLGSSSDVSQQLASDIGIWSRGLLAPPLTAVPWSRARKALRARRRIADQLKDIIRQGNYRPDGLLAKLLGARVLAVGSSDSSSSEWQLSTDEVIDNLLTLLFAGSDTTASVIMSLWKVLAEHPKVKDDLKKLADDDDQVDALLRLVMQAHPPAPFAMRLVTEEVSVGGYRIPANWLVVYGLAGALLSRTEPHAWNLEATEESTTSRAASWLPFGTGPRQCPGRFLASLELRCAARNLAESEWELEPGQNLAQRYTPGLFPVDGFKVKFASSPPKA